MITGRDMKAPIATAHVPIETRTVTDVTLDRLKGSSLQPAQIAFVSCQGFHAVPSCHELVDKVRTDESGGTCNEAIHSEGGILTKTSGTAIKLWRHKIWIVSEHRSSTIDLPNAGEGTGSIAI